MGLVWEGGFIMVRGSLKVLSDQKETKSELKTQNDKI